MIDQYFEAKVLGKAFTPEGAAVQDQHGLRLDDPRNPRNDLDAIFSTGRTTARAEQ
jgi:hypothetical protein